MSSFPIILFAFTCFIVTVINAYDIIDYTQSDCRLIIAIVFESFFTILNNFIACNSTVFFCIAVISLRTEMLSKICIS